jgi:hypothetical protein
VCRRTAWPPWSRLRGSPRSAKRRSRCNNFLRANEAQICSGRDIPALCIADLTWRGVTRAPGLQKNVWRAPFASGFRRHGLTSLLQRIRSRDQFSRPRWRSAHPGPNKPCRRRCAIFLTRVPECRSTVRPSRFPPPQTCEGRLPHYHARPTNLDYAVVETSKLKVLPCRNTAQAMRASLLANATTAAFLCILAINACSHPPNGVGLKQRRQGGSCAMDQKLAEILVAPLADPD